MSAGSSPSVTFPTNYASIVERIAQIDPVRYCKTRNFIDGGVTYLSPYISRGVISIKQVHKITLAHGFAPATMEKFLQELAWREYFQRVWQAKGDALFEDIRQPQTPVVHRQMIAALVNAATGINVIDSLIQEFYNTGYLHNHVRMYIASIACCMGRAHWFTPARWMYAQLLDGDLASNTCSWQWVAGTFSNKKYYCNQENINRYTNSYQQHTFLDAPTETLHDAPVPPALEATVTWTLETQLPVAQKVRIDVTKPTVVYNSYNLDPLWRKTDDVNRVLLLEPSHFKKYPVSEKVLNFILALAANIEGIQVFTGEVSDLLDLYNNPTEAGNKIISKEHPAFTHYPGIKDERDWIYPNVTGYYPSFFSFWNRLRRS